MTCLDGSNHDIVQREVSCKAYNFCTKCRTEIKVLPLISLKISPQASEIDCDNSESSVFGPGSIVPTRVLGAGSHQIVLVDFYNGSEEYVEQILIQALNKERFEASYLVKVASNKGDAVCLYVAENEAWSVLNRISRLKMDLAENGKSNCDLIDKIIFVVEKRPNY